MPNDTPQTPPQNETPPQEEHNRQAQPVDTEEPPRLPFPVVGIGASAGGLEAVTDFLSAVRPDSGMAYVFIQHLPPTGETMLVDILSKRTDIPVLHVDNEMPVEPNHLYVIRPGHTLTIADGKFHLGPRLATPMHNRPVDDFFKSLAEEQRERAIAVVMSGMGSNGAAGAQAIKAVGGLAVAQDPETTNYPSMPRHLIDAGYADFILRPRDMPAVLLEYATHPYAKGEREQKAALAKRDQQHLREILAVLRTRTSQDFNGYKKPTVLRRIQRRMGLNRVTRIGEYARLLRQSPSEVSALADDLLIHVTGFFRDAQAWETLRERVIVPLIASRENDESIRCWVTACSSGEEAYTLAILLTEEAQRVNKTLDVKVFATDMAERTLQNARNGIYPGGIEAEITQERLNRFFEKQDAVYRVRAELRERVIFAPQNVLQDPPFSRLDIVSCRNLLIYLEPDVQTRILSLLHFGLREGGALFLGTSEAVNTDDLFEPIDKQARIYRRVGPTRQSITDFPAPRSLGKLNNLAEGAPAPSRQGSPRPSMAQMVTHALIEHHTPAAVTIDRERRIVFFHGNVEPFLSIPGGEPTRDLLDVARQSVRGAIRNALNRAAASNQPVTALDGSVEIEPGRTVRIAVTVSPLDPKNAPGYLIVSFQDRGEQLADPAAHAAAEKKESSREGFVELQRVREELQSTIEELQTSNEELKASHEEVVSTNEELQSANEELETGREEMQSLNEELNTVNAQLRAKVEEYQAVSNDLASLLASTNIAVLFLDTRLRIRRFTPPMRELLDMINTDLGRPLADLHRKFTDADLDQDVQRVLEQLIPAEREVPADNGRFYLRRVLPYRTADNRIDGVVVTFVDITDRHQAEESVREKAERLRRIMNIDVIGVAIFNQEGVLTEANDAYMSLTGYNRADVSGKTLHWRDLTPPEYLQASTDQFEKLAQTGRIGPYEKEYIRKDGSRAWMLFVGAGLADGTIVEYCIDISDRKRAEQSLRAAKSAADEANRVKDEFLAVLSHELRTPLSAILLWSKMLRSRTISDPDQIQEGIRSILNSAEAQKELIEDLLDVSRIATGKLQLHLRDIELRPVIQDVLEAIAPSAEARELKLNIRISDDIGVVRIDSDRIRQIVWNLLSNAVKFTPARGQIDIVAVRHDSEVEIRVSDTGKGIHPNFLPHVFERFRQADSSQTRTEGGVGLGLSIVKQLVESHGGTVEAESAGIGRGATFIVRLPLPKSAHKTRKPAATGKPPRDDGQAPKLDGLDVILIEDDASTRTGLALMLRQHKLKVREFDAGDPALQAFEKSRPDLIICDIAMPDMDGYAFIRRIRERESTNGHDPIPAIALTAFARDTDRRLAIEAGFDRHLGKPIDADELIGAIEDILRAK